MKELLELPKILYHGTTSENKQHLDLTDINKIDINYGDRFSDFSQGFYLTSIYKQALSYARLNANRTNKIENAKVHPVVIKYELDINGLQGSCKGKIFSKADEQWAGFIYNNRVKSEDKCNSGFHNRNKTYDYVYGHLADGKITTAINEYRNTKVFLEEILPKFPNNNDQISLHSTNAISYLKFIEILHDTSYNKR